MAWEVTLQRIDQEPLPDVSTVRTNIERAAPGIHFLTEPSGLQKLEAAKKLGVTFPEVLVKHFEKLPEKLHAILNTDGLSITIYGFEAKPLTRLHAEIRGTQNPMPILRSICSIHSWQAIDDATGTIVLLDEATPRQWLAFTDYRDGIIAEDDNPPDPTDV